MGKFGIVKKPKSVISVEELKTRFPGKKNTITDETVELINEAMEDPSFSGEDFINTLVDYQNVMMGCSASMKDYINAIKFCAYLESEEFSITDAYKLARARDPFVIERANLPTDSVGYRELTSRASRYNKTPLVRQILTQSDMPLYLMFQGARYKAVQVLANEMVNAQYSKDRITAAEKLLTHVKPPENQKLELSVGMNAEAKSVQEQLFNQLAVMSIQQKKLLEAGADIRSVQKLGLSADVLEAEVVE